MILILLRHGSTKTNKDKLIQGKQNNPLSNEGIEEAKNIAKTIKKEFDKIDYFYSSPLVRAINTLKYVIKKYENKDFAIDKGLIERDFGILENKPVNQMVYYNNDNIAGFESNTLLEQRVSDTIFNLYKKHKDNTILCSCHSHTIKAFLVKHLNFDYKESFKNCEYAVIKIDDGNIKLLRRVVYEK